MKKDIVYKLTTQDNKTRKGFHNECIWGPGVTHFGTGKGDLCGPGYIHAYTHPLLAVLLNPIHAIIKNPRLWECETVIVKNDRGLKVGGIFLTTIKEIPLPVITDKQLAKFAKLCASHVASISFYNTDADAAANAAYYAAYYADAAADAAADVVNYNTNAAYYAAAAAAAAAVADCVAPPCFDFLIECAEQAVKE